METAYRLKWDKIANIFIVKKDLEVSLETHHKQSLEMCNSWQKISSLNVFFQFIDSDSIYLELMRICPAVSLLQSMKRVFLSQKSKQDCTVLYTYTAKYQLYVIEFFNFTKTLVIIYFANKHVFKQLFSHTFHTHICVSVFKTLLSSCEYFPINTDMEKV